MSSVQGLNIGLMNEAYFVNRTELLHWIQDFFKLEYEKIEQTGTGAFACQVMDHIYPGKVPMSNVSFNAKQEYEYIDNYKILQAVFTKMKIDKYIPVDKLVRCKYQDNLEFLQWLRHFWKVNANMSAEYDPVNRRQNCKGGDYQGKLKKQTGAAGLSAFGAAPSNRNPTRLMGIRASPNTLKTNSIRSNQTTQRPGRPDSLNHHLSQPHQIGKSLPNQAASNTASRTPQNKSQLVEERIHDLATRVEAQEAELGSLIAERSHLQDKIAMIEEFCQSFENQMNPNDPTSNVIKTILSIIYNMNTNSSDELKLDIFDQHGEACQQINHLSAEAFQEPLTIDNLAQQLAETNIQLPNDES